jgi:hypothetical protein
MDEETKRKIALWRFGVLGPLVSARLEHGDRITGFMEAARRIYQHPIDGRNVKLEPDTISHWFYKYRAGGFGALYPKDRSDRRQTRAIRPDVADLIVRVKRERPRRSIRRIIRMLERAKVVTPGELSRSSVHRLLRVHGVSTRPPRGAVTERRSFIVEHASDVWMGDALHGPLVIAPDGKVRKSYMLSQIDVATRYIVYSYFALSENAVAHEYGFKQAVARHGPPGTYYVDLGAAYIATSLCEICAELGTHLVHTAPRDCEAKVCVAHCTSFSRE